MTTTETRQPGHTITIEPSTSHVVVRTAHGAEVIAESDRGHVMHETGMPDRWYIPMDDVQDMLVASETTSHCPFKGDASYYSIKLHDGQLLKDAVWVYTEPLDLASRVQGEVSFWTHGVTVEVDGANVPI